MSSYERLHELMALPHLRFLNGLQLHSIFMTCGLRTVFTAYNQPPCRFSSPWRARVKTERISQHAASVVRLNIPEVWDVCLGWALTSVWVCEFVHVCWNWFRKTKLQPATLKGASKGSNLNSAPFQWRCVQTQCFWNIPMAYKQTANEGSLLFQG